MSCGHDSHSVHVAPSRLRARSDDQVESARRRRTANAKAGPAPSHRNAGTRVSCEKSPTNSGCAPQPWRLRIPAPHEATAGRVDRAPAPAFSGRFQATPSREGGRTSRHRPDGNRIAGAKCLSTNRTEPAFTGPAHDDYRGKRSLRNAARRQARQDAAMTASARLQRHELTGAAASGSRYRRPR